MKTTYAERIALGDEDAINGFHHLMDMNGDIEIPKEYINAYFDYVNDLEIKLLEKTEDYDELKLLYDDWNEVRNFIQNNYNALEEKAGVTIYVGKKISAVVLKILRGILDD
jgi:hypothetical protein